MMIRVNDEFLDLREDTDIEMERQVKLFEQIDGTASDFSYSFTLPKTSRNLSIIGNPFPDVVSKPIYNNMPCTLTDDGNVPLYVGLLRIERITQSTIEASFYSGNFEWMNLITGNLKSLSWSEYNYNVTEANIEATWNDTKGLVYPLIDIGGLISRSYRDLLLEDFTGCLYVKDIFRKVFSNSGLKYNGEILNDWFFNNTIICKSNHNTDQINNRSSFANKPSNQDVLITTVDKITFTDDSTYPYFDGSQNNYSTVNSRYTADVDMNLILETNVLYEALSGTWGFELRIYKNGAQYAYYTATGAIKRVIPMEAGDYIEIYFEAIETVPGTFRINAGSTVRFTPDYLFYTFGESLVPDWSCLDFVLTYLNIFNIISDYNPSSKTVTFNFFEKVRTKTPIDISEYIEVEEIDYAEFISKFGKENILTYQQTDDEDIRKYNVSESVKYGAGSIDVDNSFIQQQVTLISSEFKSPLSYINTAFNASLERINFIELTEDTEVEITGVTDSAGTARFAISSGIFAIGDLIRVADSTLDTYNGDWVVEAIGSGYVELSGVSFDDDATGKMIKLKYEQTNNEDVFLLVHAPPINTVIDISGLSTYNVELTAKASIGYAFFNLLNIGENVNQRYDSGLSFGEINNPLSYQRTIIENYWRSVQNILNDPVKVIVRAHFPTTVFKRLTPLTPVYIKTDKTVNMYYINRITGYKSSKEACKVELIKL